MLMRVYTPQLILKFNLQFSLNVTMLQFLNSFFKLINFLKLKFVTLKNCFRFQVSHFFIVYKVHIGLEIHAELKKEKRCFILV